MARPATRTIRSQRVPSQRSMRSSPHRSRPPSEAGTSSGPSRSMRTDARSGTGRPRGHGFKHGTGEHLDAVALDHDVATAADQPLPLANDRRPADQRFPERRLEKVDRVLDREYARA